MNRTLTVILLLILLGVGARLLPYTANFSPMGAIALFGGFYFARKNLTALLVISILLSTDLLLGFYEPELMAANYLALLFPLLFADWLKENASVLRLGVSALSASIAFFVLSNLAVWLFTAWYPANLAGLIETYVLALPFFHHTLIGNLIWSGVLFGGYQLAQSPFTEAKNR